MNIANATTRKPARLTVLSILLLFVGSAAFAGEPAALEQGYRKAATELVRCISDRFGDPKVCQRVFAEIKKADEAVYRAETEAKKIFAEKASAVRLHEHAGLAVKSVSLVPPFLKQDPNDLDKRVHSAVLIKYKTLDASGREVSAKLHEATLEAVADRKMQWSFPSCDDAVAAATARYNERALAKLRFADALWDHIVEYKFLTREGRRRQARPPNEI